MVTSSALRLVFFGTPSFAVPTLEALLASRHRVVGVVTQPDRPRGRGQRVVPGLVKARAEDVGVPVLQPVKLREEPFLSALAALDADLGVVAAYGRILPETVLSIPRLGMINVHASLLPKYRGAAPVHRAVIAGERETGITIMRVVNELDAGPMLAVVRRPIGPDETSQHVEAALAELGATCLVATVDRLAEGPVVEEAQDHAQATHAARITREDEAIDWTRPAAALHNQVRGLYPWPHASTRFGGRRLIVLRSAVLPGSFDAIPGTVLDTAGGRLMVATGEGVLDLLEVQPEGRRPMSAREFLAGHPVTLGARLE